MSKELHRKVEKVLTTNRLQESESLLTEARQSREEITEPNQLWLQYYQARPDMARQSWRATESSFRKLPDQDLPLLDPVAVPA
jgi:hypothetical protein